MTNTYELFAKIIEAKGVTPYRVAKDTGSTTVLFTVPFLLWISIRTNDKAPPDLKSEGAF